MVEVRMIEKFIEQLLYAIAHLCSINRRINEAKAIATVTANEVKMDTQMKSVFMIKHVESLCTWLGVLTESLEMKLECGVLSIREVASTSKTAVYNQNLTSTHIGVRMQ